MKSNYKGIFVCKRNIKDLKIKINYIIKNYSKIQIKMYKNKLITKKKFQRKLISFLNV